MATAILIMKILLQSTNPNICEWFK